MTDRLREALRDAAADVPTYPVYERALTTARRFRRRSAIATAAALVLVALLVGVAPPLVRTPAVEPASTTDAALPDRIGLPPLGALHVTDRPRPGPAAVIFSGPALRARGWNKDGIVGVVADDTDRYRILPLANDAPAGEQVVLSADGRYLAWPAETTGEPAVDVLDLVTGRSRQLTADVPDSVTATPVAWSPDGARLVIRVEVSTPNFRSVLGAVTLDSGRWVRWTEGPEQPVFGSPVAFTRTGDRLAYQVGRVVTVAGPDGRKTSSFVLPNESWLAGKGAWTPDGRSLVLATRQAASTDWTLRAVDPTTGRNLAPLDLPQVSGVSAIRLLGWRPDGSALVVAYQPGPHAPPLDDPMEIDQRTTYGNVRAIRILALTPGADTPSTVMTAPQQVSAVDVADDVISSGRTRDASPPGGVGGRFWVWTTLVALVVAGVAAFRRRKRLVRWFDGQG